MRARWAIAACLGLLGSVVAFHGPSPDAARLLAVALAWSLLNLGVVLAQRHLAVRSTRHLRTMVTVQLAADAVLLTLVVRSTGGLHSSFLALSLPLAVAAVLLLAPRIAIPLAAGAFALPAIGGLWAPERSASAALPLTDWDAWVVNMTAGVLACWLCIAEGHRFRRRRQRTRSVRRRARAASRALVEEMAANLAQEVRDPLGMVRARAELLRLSTEEGRRPAQLRHDVDLLLESLDGVQRALRTILTFLPPSRVSGQVAVDELVCGEWERRGEPSDRLLLDGERDVRIDGSHEELSLGVALLLRLAQEQGRSSEPVRFTVRPVGEGGIALQVGFTPSSLETWRSAPTGLVDGPGGAAVFLPLTVLERIADNHNGRLVLKSSSEQVRVSLELGGSSVGAAVRKNGDREASID